MRILLAAGAAASIAVAGPLHVESARMGGHRLTRSLDRSSYTISADGCPVYDYRRGRKLEAQWLPCASYLVSYADAPIRFRLTTERGR